MTRYAAGVEYSGTNFHGWEVQQPDVRTVQGEVEKALSKVADHFVRVTTAGRTDAGVHAAGQIIHFDSDSERSERGWVHGANANLERDLCIAWIKPVSDDFHARFSALSRSYRYIIFNRPVRTAISADERTWVYRPLDEEMMQQGANHLMGEHDFSSYRAVACQAHSPVRTIHSLNVTRHGEEVWIEVRANAFLHHMVRNIAGVLISIGSGLNEPQWAKEVLDLRDRTQGGITAPPEGLSLVSVEYPDHFDIPSV
ncbi:MAG: tRNA pseudouridine(38-40) synthase TruA [Gammaproteobacteria bacterium]|uniref:tRNA pseudouridine synthase A n=1 Tax=Candidatus Thiopontia autotrophica TaxID=2841688 RepID=A0A8J6P0Y2_9GAMM|nr:tRNA pseudouridine(38-40) synthase TruA [Candidatus Thiopontia autotrophica]MBL6969154.1 tRNA pseudouridine(38-40) synthase TruA [Gammaproteobacteria bacterium]